MIDKKKIITNIDKKNYWCQSKLF